MRTYKKLNGNLLGYISSSDVQKVHEDGYPIIMAIDGVDVMRVDPDEDLSKLQEYETKGDGE